VEANRIKAGKNQIKVIGYKGDKNSQMPVSGNTRNSTKSLTFLHNVTVKQ
jgi:hypothetical protein